MNEATTQKPWVLWKWLLIIIIPLAVGILLSLLIPQPVIGVIYLNDAIYSGSAQDMITQLVYAREHAEIRAVVLVINSPGGTVSDCESIYMEINRLRQTKPVVTMVEGMAASAAYYISAGTDFIYAKPSSMVGNVGVISTLPQAPMIFETTYSTGPYKLWGEPRDHSVRIMEMLKQGFLNAVLLGRGDRLKIGPDVILTGRIWMGSEALKMGLIDAMGAQSEAFDKAAQLASIAHYQTADLRKLSGLPQIVSMPFFFMAPDGTRTNYPKEPGTYYLYIPELEVTP